jgi:DNA polymerase III alpha subunit
MADIDIDFPDRELALSLLQHVPAAMNDRGKRIKHRSGVYFQNIPVNPVDGYAAFTYEQAEKQGYFKIDFLPNSIYEGVRDEAHLAALLDDEPPWELFQEEEVVSKLAQVSNHIQVLKVIKPQSIEDLAVCLALIRPGKTHLLNCDREKIDKEIWSKTEGGYAYKKSHAIAFAASVVVQLNLIIEQLYG